MITTRKRMRKGRCGNRQHDDDNGTDTLSTDFMISFMSSNFPAIFIQMLYCCILPCIQLLFSPNRGMAPHCLHCCTYSRNGNNTLCKIILFTSTHKCNNCIRMGCNVMMSAVSLDSSIKHNTTGPPYLYLWYLYSALGECECHPPTAYVCTGIMKLSD